MRQRFVEGGKRSVGVARSGEGFEERRRQFRQYLPGAGAADRRAPSKMPTANGLRCGFRVLKPKGAQSRERRGIISDAGEHEVAGRNAELRRILEQPRIVPL